MADKTISQLPAAATPLANSDKVVGTRDGLTAVAMLIGDIKAAVTPTAADIGLGQVDNTRDADKPVSTAQAAAIAAAASGSFSYAVSGAGTVTTSGTPTAGAGVTPTAAACQGLRLLNLGVGIEYQRKVSGVFGGAWYPFSPNGQGTIWGLTDASDVQFRRVDYATARPTTGLPNQVSIIDYELLTSSSSIVVTNATLQGTNAAFSTTASTPCAAVELKNISTKDQVYRIDGGSVLFRLKRNSSKLMPISNLNRISVRSADSIGSYPVSVQVFQSFPPNAALSTLRVADLITAETSVAYGDTYSQDKAMREAELLLPAIGGYIPFKNVRRVISLWDTVANSFITGGSSTDAALAADEVYPSSVLATRVQNSFGSTTTNQYRTANNAIAPVDVTNCNIEALIYRIGTTGVVSSHEIRLYSSGTPSSPDTSNYAKLEIKNDIGAGFSDTWNIYPRSFGIQDFTDTGTVNRTAITYAAIFVTSSTAGTVVSPCEVAAVKQATPGVGFFEWSVDDLFTSQVGIGFKAVLGAKVPFMFFASPVRERLGYTGFIPLDVLLKLNKKDGWQWGAQDWGDEENKDMTGMEWMKTSSKVIGMGLQLGIPRDDLADHSLYGTGPYYMTAEQIKLMPRLYASRRRFDNPPGTAIDAQPISYFADTFPPGDPYNMRAFNLNAYSDMSNTSAIVAKMLAYVDRAIAIGGIARIAFHDDLGTAARLAVFNGVNAGLLTRVAAGTLRIGVMKEARRLSQLVS